MLDLEIRSQNSSAVNLEIKKAETESPFAKEQP